MNTAVLGMLVFIVALVALAVVGSELMPHVIPPVLRR